MIRSKFTILTWPFAIVLTILPVQILYMASNIVIDNLSHLTDFTVVVQIVVLALTILFLLLMLERHTRSYVIHSGTLEVKHFLGLSKRSYDFRDLKFSCYSWTTKLALLELPNGRQLTLGKSQYLNFDEIVEILKGKVQNDRLKFKFVNRLTIFIVIALVLLFLMIFQLGKR
jgi:hypothetical protein